MHTLRTLTDNDRTVLAAVELPYRSVTELAKRLGMRPHTIQYSLLKLREAGVLQHYRAWIDVHRLGYFYVTVCLKPAFSSAEGGRVFIESVCAIPECTWLFEIGGDYRYACSLTVRDIGEVAKFYRTVSALKGVSIVKKAMNVQRDFEFFGRRYLSEHGTVAQEPIFLPSAEVSVPLDEQDLAVLRALSTEVPSTDTQMARSCQMPRPTFARRLAQLEKRGIVRGFCFWVDSSFLGRQLYLVRIFAPGLVSDLKARLWKFAHSNPYVVYVVESIGSWDFELGIDIETAAELTSVTEALHRLGGAPGIEVDAAPIMKFFKIRGL